MNIIVVGAGKIGQERIKALEMLGESIIAVVDPNVKQDKYSHVESIGSFSESFQFDKIDWVFICTPHDQAIKIAQIALKNGCNILVEKPLGRTLSEADFITTFKSGQRVNVGFNYRFYKGVRQLLTDCQNKLFGDLISVNMVLGLSNPAGTEKTWRLDPKRAGSGSIIYAGIHLIDLALLISNGDLIKMGEVSSGKFWGTGIEEEIHILASTKSGTIFNIQSSVDRWRSTFRIEVNGTDGYGIVEGRNRYYGNQTYIRGKRWGWQSGKSQRESEELVVDYDGEDSFLEETRAVLYGCEGIQPGTFYNNLYCLEFIEE